MIGPGSKVVRRRVLVGAAIVIAAAAGVAAIAGELGSSPASSAGGSDNGSPTSLSTITRRPLSSQTQVSATLGYADPSAIVEPVGTAPSAVQQARATVTTDRGMLQAARVALSADNGTLAQDQAELAAAGAKEAVDCGGVNAAQSPPSGSGSSGAGGSGASPCASDEQTMTTTEQGVTADTGKVESDRAQVSAAANGLAGAETALSTAESTAASYDQTSTYTELPAIGRIVGRGQSLYAISDQPVVLLYGGVAAWRAFAAGMSAGADVAELNANLRALGYGPELTGDAFTSATSAAIDALQSAHGIAPTGRLLIGSVVFEPGPVRVTSVTPTVGAPVQAGPVLAITSTVREVTIALDAAQQSEVRVDDPVTITLPDNSTTPGRVSYVGTVATVPSSSGDQGGGGSSTPTIEVDVAPTHPGATGRLDQAPVNVSITTASVERALVVPVNSLLALASGGYAVEEVAAGGAHRLVAVSLGLFDDAEGLVQVTGTGIAAGQRIVVPAQ